MTMVARRIVSSQWKTLGGFYIKCLLRLLLPVLLVPPFCVAQVSFVQQSYAVPQTPQSSVSVTFAAAQLAGDTNIVAIGWSDSTSSVTTVTDAKGNTYTLAIGPTRQAGVQSQAIYISSNISAAVSGTNVVLVSFNNAVPFADVRILEYGGLDMVSPLDGTAGSSGNSTTSSSGAVTTGGGYDLVFAANYVSTHTVSGGNSFVNRMITEPDGDIAEDQIVTGAGNYTATAQISNGTWVMQAIALRAAGPPPPPPDPSVVGQWSSVTSWPILPIHVILMPTGKVLAWGHDAGNNRTAGTIWDPNTSGFQTTSFSGGDLFCAGHGLLPDGRVLVAGGHNMADYVGLKNATLFNPTTLTWSSASPMSYGRWYPTVTSLPDGHVLVTSGAINCN